MTRRRRPGLLAAAVVVVALASSLVGARFAGELLVRRDPFVDADVAIVLSGEPLTRTLAARDLYRDRRVRRIVIIPEMELPATVQHELDTLHIQRESPISVRILLASGIPSSAFVLLPEAIDGTIGEAQRIRALLDAQPSDRIVVITAKWASRRACFVFERVLGRRDITCWPTSYDSFEPRAWWRQPRTALTVVMEYQKLVVNALTLLFTGRP